MNLFRVSICTVLTGLLVTACGGDQGGTSNSVTTSPTDSTGGPVVGTPGGGGAGATPLTPVATGPGAPAVPGANPGVADTTAVPGATPATPAGPTPDSPIVPTGTPGGPAVTPAGGGAGPTTPVPGGGGMPVAPGGGGAPPVTPGGGGSPGVAGSPAPAGGSAGTPPDMPNPEPDVPEPTLVSWAQGGQWQEGEATEGGSSPNFTVNSGQTYQQWLGFGGTFNEMGWDALSVLDSAERDRAIRLLFDKTEGIGFTFGRVPIGSSDYGTSRYTLDEQSGDYEMNSFSIDRDKEMLIPYIQAALAVKPDISFWATAWTPPPWMKSNNAYDRGSMKTDAQTLGAYALYLAKFVQAYAGEGIDIRAVGPQNEPGYEQDYPSCAWTAQGLTDFVANYMGPTFADMVPDTEIWFGTMSNPDSNSRVTTAMGDATARGYIKGIGLQWGMDQYASGYAQNYGIPIHQTEHQCGNYPWDGGNTSMAPNDFAYGEESWGLLTKWIKANVNSYAAWNMVLDTAGRSLDTVRPWAQNALLVVDRGQKKLIETPTYYIFRAIGQYVDPGATRIGINGDALAFKNPDGSIVAVMRTNQAGQMTVSIDGTNVQFQSAGNGWATVNWPG
jgi:glucosylceramidase